MSRRGPAGPARVLCVDKPAGPTSFDVVRVVRRVSGQRRVGHAGTLDPFATGVLVVGMGPATRLLGLLAGGDKIYHATVRFGMETDSGDPSGEVVGGSEVQCDRDAILAALPAFRGRVVQVPPRLSAIRIDGRRSYERARAGEIVDPPPREVEVYDFDLLEWSSPIATFRVRCSGGTYIRSLARDLGRVLGCGGHLQALRREAVGPFTLDQAVALDELPDRWQGGLIALEPVSMVRGWPQLTLDAVQVDAVRHGRQPDPSWWSQAHGTPAPERLALLDASGRLVATARRAGEHWLELVTVLPPVEVPSSREPS